MRRKGWTGAKPAPLYNPKPAIQRRPTMKVGDRVKTPDGPGRIVQRDIAVGAPRVWAVEIKKEVHYYFERDLELIDDA
jgi:hypothetical protein